MTANIDSLELDAELRRCGSSWNAMQAHGLLCSRLALSGTEGASRWLMQVLETPDTDDESRAACESLLVELCTATWQQLSGRQSDFVLLLPGDDEPPAVRAEGIGHWCEGFLHGLVSDDHAEKLRERLAAEPMADIIRDMLQITRATADDDDDEDGGENAWAELVEYLRVATQLAYEELAEFRAPREVPADDESATLH